MTFSKQSISKGAYNVTDLEWELHRFCCRKNCLVVGIASRLLKYFENNYICKDLITFADLRWSAGDLYNKLGFTFEYKTKPSYWYFKNKKRLHRFALRKTFNDPVNKTEIEIRKEEGWNRIWDCGNLKYEMEVR